MKTFMNKSGIPIRIDQYTQTFRYNNLGYGAAISIVMVLMMMVIVVPYIIATTQED